MLVYKYKQLQAFGEASFCMQHNQARNPTNFVVSNVFGQQIFGNFYLEKDLKTFRSHFVARKASPLGGLDILCNLLSQEV